MLAGLVEGEALLGMGESDAGDALIEAAQPLLDGIDPVSELADVVGMAAQTSLWIERFDRAEQILDRLIAGARRAGAAGRLAYPLAVRSMLEWRRGQWPAAQAAADEALRLARLAGQSGMLALALAQLARVEGGRGQLDAARRHAQQGRELAGDGGAEAIELHAAAALGFVELTDGQAERAAELLDEADRIGERQHHVEPAVMLFAADRVEALARCGRLDDAQEAFERLVQRIEGTRGAWNRAVVARCRVLLDDDAQVEAQAAIALEWHDRAPLPFERARTELVLGERLRRARRRADAREPLERALAGFERLGAAPWAQRARSELALTGAVERAPAPAALEDVTPQELQVAQLVADGLTNREVAAALFLSRRTVEQHLTNVYRKLDVRSRTQLAVLLAQPTQPFA
jgi:ATP/maltotriose-dependent transcriptional regulator MalT